MFGNKHWRWKLGALLALLAVLAFTAGARGKSVNPPIWKCLARPDVWDGSEVWFQTIVEETTEQGFTCRLGDALVEFRGGSYPPVGELVEIAGTFRRDGPHVEVRRMRIVPPHAQYRWILNVVSLILLLLVVANFLKHFAVRPEAARVEGAD